MGSETREFRKSFAKNLRAMRTDKGMSQTDLAKQIGVTPNCISLYESARRVPNVEMTSMIANALEVGVEELIPKVVYRVPVDEYQGVLFEVIEDGGKDHEFYEPYVPYDPYDYY